jgi:hypothetical protein
MRLCNPGESVISEWDASVTPMSMCQASQTRPNAFSRSSHPTRHNWVPSHVALYTKKANVPTVEGLSVLGERVHHLRAFDRMGGQLSHTVRSLSQVSGNTGGSVPSEWVVGYDDIMLPVCSWAWTLFRVIYWVKGQFLSSVLEYISYCKRR